MNCPRCQSPLQPRIYEADIEIDACPCCGGVWLDKGELQRIEDTVEIDYSRLLRRPDQPIERVYEMARQKALPAISCPKCGSQLFKKEAHPSSGIVVDLCVQCSGLWLDRGELESLEVFVERMRQEERQATQRDFFTRLSSLFGG